MSKSLKIALVVFLVVAVGNGIGVYNSVGWILEFGEEERVALLNSPRLLVWFGELALAMILGLTGAVAVLRHRSTIAWMSSVGLLLLQLASIVASLVSGAYFLMGIGAQGAYWLGAAIYAWLVYACSVGAPWRRYFSGPVADA